MQKYYLQRRSSYIFIKANIEGWLLPTKGLPYLQEFVIMLFRWLNHLSNLKLEKIVIELPNLAVWTMFIFVDSNCQPWQFHGNILKLLTLAIWLPVFSTLGLLVLKLPLKGEWWCHKHASLRPALDFFEDIGLILVQSLC